MLDSLVVFFAGLSGPDFLIYFSVLAALILGLARLSLWADGSVRYQMPGPTRLQPRSLAALRDGSHSLIYLALLRLWQSQQVCLDPGAGRHPRVISRGTGMVPRDPTEALLHRFAFSQPRRPMDFFRDRGLSLKVNNNAASVYQELERMHLRRSQAQMRGARRLRLLILALLLLLGGSKLVVDLAHGQAMGPLPGLLVLMLCCAWLLLRPSVTTRLGRKYLRVIRKRFVWMKSAPSEEADPALVLALFGVSGLAGFPDLADFYHLFGGKASHDAGTDGNSNEDGDAGGDGGGGD